MIKKIVALVILLLVMVVPSVLGDETPMPSHTPYVTAPPIIDPAYITGGILNIECSIKTKEVEIGGELLYDVTLTNMTEYEVSVIYMRTGITESVIIRSSNEEFKYYEDKFIINPHEKIVMEMKGMVSSLFFENGYWRKEGEDFFYDFNLSILVGMYTGDDNYGNYQYFDDEFIPIQITNIYDGNEYIDYEWTDDRDTIYFYDAIGYDFRYESDEFISSESMYKKSFIYYDIYCENKSNAILHLTKQKISDGGMDRYVLESGDTIIDYGLYEGQNKDYVIPDETEIVHRWQFTIDNKYYGVEVKRKYKTEYVEMPPVSIEVNKVDKPDSKHEYNYEFFVTNTSELPIENLFVITTDDMQDIKNCTLKPRESWQLEGGYDYEHGYSQIRVGYLLDGMFLWWPIKNIYSEDEKSIFELDTHLIYGMNDYHINYVGMNRKDDELIQESPSPTIVPSPTINPTQAPTATPLKIQIGEQPPQKPNYTIMIISFVIVHLLAWWLSKWFKVKKKVDDELNAIKKE